VLRAVPFHSLIKGIKNTNQSFTGNVESFAHQVVGVGGGGCNAVSA
jgi:hypothetical protein